MNMNHNITKVGNLVNSDIVIQKLKKKCMFPAKEIIRFIQQISTQIDSINLKSVFHNFNK
jgi:hypothetical protein